MSFGNLRHQPYNLVFFSYKAIGVNSIRPLHQSYAIWYTAPVNLYWLPNPVPVRTDKADGHSNLNSQLIL